MRRRRRNPFENPLSEVLIIASSTALGIVIGTVLSTLIVEQLQIGKQIPQSTTA
jgi:pheromone shutdown protein TraB